MPETDAVWKIIADSIARVEGKVDAGIAALTARLENKADKSDVAKIEARLDAHESRIERVERKEVAHEAAVESNAGARASRTDRFRWAVTTVIALISCAALIVTIFHG